MMPIPPIGSTKSIVNGLNGVDPRAVRQKIPNIKLAANNCQKLACSLKRVEAHNNENNTD